MLNSLYIKNFRQFKELKIERLGQINLLVGKNNSGKTCLLEALWIYASNAAPSVLRMIISEREEYWEHCTKCTRNGCGDALMAQKRDWCKHEGSRVLLVEGKNDCHVIAALCQAHNFSCIS